MKRKYRGVELEVECFPDDEMTGLYAHQEADGLEIFCYYEHFLAKPIKKRLDCLAEELDEVFENPSDYGFIVVDGELKLEPDESDYRHNRSVDMSGQMQIEDYEWGRI